jgi:DMSO/TMAO reductase YedYZ molybdopterin-dependent catalytic subunit
MNTHRDENASEESTVEFDRTPLDVEAENIEVEREIRRLSRRSFLRGGVAVGAGVLGWRWLNSQRTEDGIIWPLRRAHEFNEQLTRDYFSPARLAQTFPRAQAVEPRVNGTFGLVDENGDYLSQENWGLQVQGLASGEDLILSLAEIKALPKQEMTTELKCIEGWSVVVNWGGARLADFAAHYPPATKSGEAPDVQRKPQDLVEYVSLLTPNEEYYVGMDMASALHPQTLLCYEMNGKPLTPEHGAPLRLVTPVKYGIKHIKCIGTIRFTSQRPADYWAEQGYDWYSGH